MEKLSPVRAKAKPGKRVVIFETDDAPVAGLDEFARATQVSRSWIIRAVLSGWLADKKLGRTRWAHDQ